ncbi:transposase [Streptomyces sp. C10-9-1]|uniref:transposase n=1 Tax=Streptomyces sp. C10-9-1 TaxID=1859285 RepID=UPI003D743E2B
MRPTGPRRSTSGSPSRPCWSRTSRPGNRWTTWCSRRTPPPAQAQDLRLPHSGRDQAAASARPRGIAVTCPRSRGNFTSAKTVTEVAREIGVSAEGLRNWVKQDTIDRGQGAPGELTTAEREELRRLRRQNREQAETIEVLRKAAVFFAKESDR